MRKPEMMTYFHGRCFRAIENTTFDFHRMRACALRFTFCLFAFCVLTAMMHLPTAMAADVVVEPTVPLLNVPFRITVSSLRPGESLFLTRSATCNVAEITGSLCTVPANRVCLFTVTDGSVGVDARYEVKVPPLYVCSSVAHQKPLRTLQVDVIDAVPRFYYSGVSTTITIGSSTPEGTKFVFFSDECTTPIPNMSALTLSANHQLQLHVTSWHTLLSVCAVVPVVDGSVTNYVRAAALVAAQLFSLNNTFGLRHTSQTYKLTPWTHFPKVSFSSSSTCLPLSQDVVKSTELQIANVPIKVARGKYYLCAELPYSKQLVVFASSREVVDVKEYGIQPHTMYAKSVTTMKLTMDAVSQSSDVGLFLSSDCQQSPVVEWSTNLFWTVTVPGTYYACVRKDGLTALATKVLVLNTPTPTLSRTAAIRGFNITATLNRDGTQGIIAVGVSTTSSCLAMVSHGTTTATGNKASFHVPADALPSMTLCISTPLPEVNAKGEEPDSGYLYAVKTIQTQAFDLSYGPIFTGRAVTLRLDKTVELSKGSKAMFVKGDCISTGSSDAFELGPNIHELVNVVFPESATYSFCVSEEGSTFSRVLSLTAYGKAVLSANTLVIGTPTDITISAIPPLAPVNIVASDACEPTTTPLTKATSDAKGTAKINLSLKSEANLTVCVGYRGSDTQSAWAMVAAGTIYAAQPRTVPNAIVIKQVNRVNIVVPNKAALKGFRAYVIEGSLSCGSPPSTGVSDIVLPNEGHAYILHTPTTTGTLKVCVGGSDNLFIHAGDILVVVPMTLTVVNPAAGALNLPFVAQFGGDSLRVFQPTRYFVTDTENSCARVGSKTPSNYNDGTVNPSSGELDAFVAKTLGKIVICAGWEDASGTYFVYGGQMDIKKFTALSRYAVRGVTNNLIGNPMLHDSSLYLVKCSAVSTCKAPIDAKICSEAKQRFYTSKLLPLQGASLGQHVMCQEDVNRRGVAASDVLVTVVDPFVGIMIDSDVRQYKKTVVTITGGDMASRNGNTPVTVVPSSTDCATTIKGQREDFVLAAGSSNFTMTLTKIEPYTKVKLCIEASASDVFTAGTFDLLPYMTPAVVVSGRSTLVRSGEWKKDVLTKLSVGTDCSDNAMSVKPSLVENYVSTVLVNGCDSGNLLLKTLYYCESTDGGGTYALRGAMSLIRLQHCSTGAPAGIVPTTVSPSTPVKNYGVDTTLLTVHGMSLTAVCDSQLVSEKGYTPRFDEPVRFFVCVSAKTDPTFLFTTDAATLIVENHVATPRTVLSRRLLSSTADTELWVELRLNFPVLSGSAGVQAFVSDSTTCGNVVVNTPDLSESPPRARVLFKNISGLKYICASAVSDTKVVVPVAVFLAVNPPVVSRVDPALVRGAPFHATLTLSDASGGTPTYSLIPGADVSSVFAPFYLSSFRGVYLSIDKCANVVKGSSVVHVNIANRVAIPTANITVGWSSFTLCAGTPAGNYSVAGSIALSTDVIFPSQFVLGVDTEVYIPLSPNSVFQMSRDEDCSTVSKVPSFITNNEGRGTLSFRDASNSGPLPTGRWTLCKETLASADVGRKTANTKSVGAATTLRPLATVEAFNPVFFNIRGTNVVVGAPTVMYLLDELNAASLLPGFSTSRDCSDRSELYGSWTRKGLRQILVEAREATKNLYLCAVTPVNYTTVSIPSSGGIQFLSPTFTFPSIVARCESVSMSSCASPGLPPAQAFMAVIKGDCCNLADRGNVVGRVAVGGNGKTCSLKMDPKMVKNYPSGTTYSVCELDQVDTSYCTTVGIVKTSDDACAEETAASSKSAMSTETFGIIVIFSVIFVLLLIVLIAYILLRCRRKDRILVAQPLDTIGSGSSHHPTLSITDKRTSPYTVGSSLGRGFTESERNPLVSASPEGPTISNSRSYYSSSPSPHIDRQDLYEGIEEDDREQIALQEARERYTIRIAFSEAMEWIRVAEKECELEGAFSDDGFVPNSRVYNKYENFNPLCFPRNSTIAPLPAYRVPSAPPLEEINTTVKKEVEECVANASGACLEVQKLRPLTASLGSDIMSYAQTECFYDTALPMEKQEADLRKRLEKLEEGERHDMVDAEFNEYIRVQQSISPMLPLPYQNPVLPGQPMSWSDEHYGVNDAKEIEVYEAPREPVIHEEEVTVICSTSPREPPHERPEGMVSRRIRDTGDLFGTSSSFSPMRTEGIETPLQVSPPAKNPLKKKFSANDTARDSNRREGSSVHHDPFKQVV